MKKLIKGLHKFQTEVFPIQQDFFNQLAQGQNPEILFITCSDSRINPHLVTSADPGDLFIVRNAGNIVPPYNVHDSLSATVEFAVNQLKVKHIIVCGHSYCGAVESTTKVDSLHQSPALQDWITRYICPTLALVTKNYADHDTSSLLDILAQEHVLQQLENLKTHPAVARAIEEDQLTLHGWIYKFEHGDIYAFNTENGQFERIKHL